MTVLIISDVFYQDIIQTVWRCAIITIADSIEAKNITKLEFMLTLSTHSNPSFCIAFLAPSSNF